MFVLTTSRSSHSCLSPVQLVGDRPDYEAAPFVNQTFFVAASAWIKGLFSLQPINVLILI